MSNKKVHDIVPDGLPGFHGELSIRAVDSIPSDVEAVTDMRRPDGSQTIGHSESGNHHVASQGELFRSKSNPMVMFLKVKGNTVVEHLKNDSTAHETFNLLADGKGETIWEIGNGREMGPKGWRKTLD